MAVDFEISSLSGTGTATIRVKPKAVNTEQTLKEQVLKVVVQGVEREVTLIQKAAPKIVETWGTYFSITPETTSHTFDGTKRGETLEIRVYSYQQKFINNEPQDEYRAIDWKIETTVDWLEVTQEVGEGNNNPGKAIIKTLSRNSEYQSGTYDPIERTGVVKLIQSEKFEKAINITQSPSVKVVTYEIRPVAGLGHSVANNPAVKTVTFRGYIVYTINGEEVATFIRPFRVPKIGETVNGNIPNPSGEPIPWKLWFTNYPAAATTRVDELTCTVHYDCRFFGISHTLVVDAQIQVGDGQVNWANADEGLRVIPNQA